VTFENSDHFDALTVLTDIVDREVKTAEIHAGEFCGAYRWLASRFPQNTKTNVIARPEIPDGGILVRV
jgi:hypothetical protein